MNCVPRIGRFHYLSSLLGLKRSWSSASSLKHTILKVDEKSNVATLALNRPPVNSLNLELLQEIHDAIDHVENSKCRGLILTSNNAGVFSAGLDIMEMYKPDQERLRKFWTALQDTWLALYGSSVATAALINGHSPAGGCLLASSCEYRVMLPKFTIGLNETRLGIVAPKWFMATFSSVLPKRTSELALLLGKMFTSEEALSSGLVDVLCSKSEEGTQKCLEYFNSYDQVNSFARAMTKQQFRAKVMQELEEERKEDLEAFVFFINQPNVQKGLGRYLEGLKKKAP